MYRLLPYGEVRQKLAALRAADDLGRRYADDIGTKTLAKTAGKLLAHDMVKYASINKLASVVLAAGGSPEHVEEFYKIAQIVLSADEVALLKEAGIFSRIGEALSKGVKKLAPAAAKGTGSFTRGEAKLLRKANLTPAQYATPTVPAAASAPHPARSGPRSLGEALNFRTPASAVPAPTPAPRGGMAGQRLQIRQNTQGQVQATPMGQGATGAGAPGRVMSASQQAQAMATAPAMSPANARQGVGKRPQKRLSSKGQRSDATIPQGQTAAPAAKSQAPGTLTPAGQRVPASPTGYQSPEDYVGGLFSQNAPTGGPRVQDVRSPQAFSSAQEAVQAVNAKSPGRLVPKAQAQTVRGAPGVQKRTAKQVKKHGKLQAKADAKAQIQQQGAALPAVGGSQTQQEGNSKGILPFLWRNRLGIGLGTAGLAGYGLYKAAPVAGRILENTSTTPMASSLGWSPVPYGYGHTPYGPGTPTMGYGA